MTPIVFYHDSCRDGQCAAWVASKALPSAELVPVKYGSATPIEMALGREVYVLDFSWKRPEMLRLMGASARTVVLDHHRTAEAELAEMAGRVMTPDAEHLIVFDMNRSGAGIAWDHFFPGKERPWPVEYVQDRDLWRFALPDSREINAYIATFDYDPKSFEQIAAQRPWKARSLGAGALAAVRAYADAACTNAYGVEVGGYRVPSVTACQHGISEVLERLMQLQPDAPFVVGWWLRADGVIQYSLRSRGEFDVSGVAAGYGGGGHKNSAGFQLPLAQRLW